jgi:hypothetical protein
MDCYIDKAQENIIHDHLVQCKWWGTDTVVMPMPRIDLQRESLVPMLTIQFVNTEKYNYNADIYDFITIDSTIVYTFANVNKANNVKFFYNFFDGIHACFEVKGQLKNVLRSINKFNPDLILYCHSLAGFHDDNGFMYIKNNKIYIYLIDKKVSFELNDYIHKFFSLDRIRNLNYVFIPSIFIQDKTHRRNGHTPVNEKQICPQ